MRASAPLTSVSEQLDQSSEDTYALAEFAHDLNYADLDSDVQQQTDLVLRDTLGVMLAGATLPEIRSLAGDNKKLAGYGQATVLSQPTTAAPHFAALVNGAGGVSLELDEGNQFAVNHPAIHVLPAAMALAEDTGSSGEELLAALIAGYEVAVRVGMATKLREAIHPFGTHAIVGTAAACSRLMNMKVPQIREAMAMAAGLTIASSQTAANSGASVRNLFTGFTNHNGILACKMVQSGFTAERGALEVVFGRVLGERYLSQETSDLDDIFYIARNYFKMYACSRWNHAPIDATATITAKHEFDPSDIQNITVWTYDPATRLNWQTPVNGYAAKHSIPFNVAARIVLSSNDIQAYSEEAVANSMVREVARRVEVREDSAFTAMLPETRPARVEIMLSSGEKLEATIERPKGGYDNPFGEVELADKFRRLAKLALPSESVTSLAELLPKLRDQQTLERLSQLLRSS